MSPAGRDRTRRLVGLLREVASRLEAELDAYEEHKAALRPVEGDAPDAARAQAQTFIDRATGDRMPQLRTRLEEIKDHADAREVMHRLAGMSPEQRRACLRLVKADRGDAS